METVIDYTQQINDVLESLHIIENLLSRQNQIIEQNNYLQIFLFGSIVALGVVILIKGLI
jgi:hypothetical protein